MDKKNYFFILLQKIKTCFSKKVIDEVLDSDLPFQNSVLANFSYEIKNFRINHTKTLLWINSKRFYTTGKILGTGRSGYVKEFQNRKDKIAVKIFTGIHLNALKRERRAIKELKICRHSIIIECAIVKDHRIIIMEKADDDVFNLIYNQKLTMKEIKSVFAQICLGIKQLQEDELYFVDLKLENILYKCVNGEYKVYFGDIGSINTQNENPTTTTFTPPNIWLLEKSTLKYNSLDIKTEIIKFCLGYILLLLVFSHDKNCIQFLNYTNNISRYTKEYYTSIAKDALHPLHVLHEMNQNYAKMQLILEQKKNISDNQFKILSHCFYNTDEHGIVCKLEQISLRTILELGINDSTK